MNRQYNPFEAIGGFNTIDRLVTAFYKRIDENPDLRSIFPEDMTESARKHKKFLTQFLGGPPLYNEEFGHPMLRARHLRFPIDSKQRDAWLDCMEKAMMDIELDEPWRDIILQHFTKTAHHMQNIYDENGREV
ncbi:MAG: globin [Tuberibacillus sp.]